MCNGIRLFLSLAVTLGPAVLAGAAAPKPRLDVLVTDFEGKDYGDWKAEGDALGKAPAKGTLPRQQRVSGYEGKGLVNTYLNGDNATGTLTSPPLKIQRKCINFLIGGGRHPGRACMNLVVGGKVVRTATGFNNERLLWQSWDVAELEGKTATIRIVDKQKGGWGHINVDQIMQSDKKKVSPPPSGPPPRAPRAPRVPTAPANREITIAKRYLHLPVKNRQHACRMKFVVEGKTVREFGIELAPESPDFWVFADVSGFAGKKMTIDVTDLPEGSKGLDAIRQADEVPGAENMYKEERRQQFHFSSRRGWNNDTNGLVYSDGLYHMYYQHNPYGWRWGNMHWGHAVSRDLVHWKELPVAIYPHRFGDWVFSGSAVVDADNTAGFKTDGRDVIVAAYTSTGRGECIAYSHDGGTTFTDYEGNPVIQHKGRDPKVIWYEPGGHWVMAVYDGQGGRGIAFYTSPDLKAWKRTSKINGYYECPEIFELALESKDGKGNTKKWVVYGADGAYQVGGFDGKTFTPDGEKARFHYGNCFYASQTFSNIPAADGRRIQMAWGRIATPGMPFNQCVLFPVELTLRTTESGPRLLAYPVREIEKLHARKHEFKSLALGASDKSPLAGVKAELMDVLAEIDLGDATKVAINVRGAEVTYDVANRRLACKGCKAPLACPKGRLSLRILVDRNSIEVFANDGEVYMPVGVLNPRDNLSISASAEGDGAKADVTVWELKSAWE